MSELQRSLSKDESSAQAPPRLPSGIALPLLYQGEFLQLFQEASQFPGIVRLDGAFFRLFQVNDATLIQEILRDKQKRYRKGKLMRQLIDVTGDGLLINDGELWRRHRRLASPAFSPRKLDGYAECMMRAAHLLVDRWRDTSEPVDLLHDMSEITLVSLLETIFGIGFDETYAGVSEVIHQMLEQVVLRGRSFFPMPLWVPTPSNLRFRKKIAEAHRTLDQIMATRRASAQDDEPVDLLGQWLQQSDEQEDGEQHFSPQEMRDELMTMLIAGHHSLAIALSWSLYEVARRPEVQARLQAEVDAFETLPQGFKAFEQMTYTRGVFLEALRFYPQPPILLRDCMEDHRLGEFSIKQGDQLLVNVLAVHHDPTCWPEPEAFLPERYEDIALEKMLQHHYLSFGGGSRSCIGRRFAVLEGCMLLAMIVRHMELTLCDPEPVPPKFAAMMVPETPLRLRLSPR